MSGFKLAKRFRFAWIGTKSRSRGAGAQRQPQNRDRMFSYEEPAARGVHAAVQCPWPVGCAASLSPQPVGGVAFVRSHAVPSNRAAVARFGTPRHSLELPCGSVSSVAEGAGLRGLAERLQRTAGPLLNRDTTYFGPSSIDSRAHYVTFNERWIKRNEPAMIPSTGKFIAYYRVSTGRQGKSGLGIDAQRAAVETYLNGGDWRIVDEHVEVELASGRIGPPWTRRWPLRAFTGHRS